MARNNTWNTAAYFYLSKAYFNKIFHKQNFHKILFYITEDASGLYELYCS